MHILFLEYYSLQGQVTLHLELKKKKKTRRCKQYIHVIENYLILFLNFA
jgi:hypothetical protein